MSSIISTILLSLLMNSGAMGATSGSDRSAMVEAVQTTTQSSEVLRLLEPVTIGCDGDTPITVPQWPKDKIIAAPSVLLVTHASTGFLGAERVLPALERRIETARKNGVPVVFLPHSLRPKALQTYSWKAKPDAVVYSEGGEHQLKVAGQSFQIAGGFFDGCAGETARDAILHADPARPIVLHYLADSIFVRNGEGTLKDALRGLSDSEISQYIQTNYFEDGRLGTQNRQEIGRFAKTTDYTFRILKNGRNIGSVGQGAKTVDLDFLLE